MVSPWVGWGVVHYQVLVIAKKRDYSQGPQLPGFKASGSHLLVLTRKMVSIKVEEHA